MYAKTAVLSRAREASSFPLSSWSFVRTRHGRCFFGCVALLCHWLCAHLHIDLAVGQLPSDPFVHALRLNGTHRLGGAARCLGVVTLEEVPQVLGHVEDVRRGLLTTPADEHQPSRLDRPSHTVGVHPQTTDLTLHCGSAVLVAQSALAALALEAPEGVLATSRTTAAPDLCEHLWSEW